MSFGPRACIRLDAFRHNFRRVRDVANGAKILAVVKANAYGHGLVLAAASLPDVDGYAVARYEEAIELQASGVQKPIVILEGLLDAAELREALRRGLQPVVHCERQVELLEDHGPGHATVWLELDTGMRRLGFEPEHASVLLARLQASRAVREVRLMTHLATADDRSSSRAERQFAAFRTVVAGFDGDISIANSPALFGWPDAISAGVAAARTWVRAGICLYGISPFDGSCGRDLGLEPVMEFSATLIAVKRVRRGDRVGYGATWEAGRDTVLGLIAAGYGDGYSRFLPSATPVQVNGRRASLAGRVSMDIAAVDLGPAVSDRVGDKVILWGPELPVEEVAAAAGTIPYQLVCGITQRVLRETDEEVVRAVG